MKNRLVKLGVVGALAFGTYSIANAGMILNISDGLGDSVSWDGTTYLDFK